MFKYIASLKAKQGLSREQFIEYYKRCHAPLIRQLLPQVIDTRRNYIDLEGAFIYDGASEPDFDLMTELWCKDRAAYDEMIAITTRTDVAKRIADDEMCFLDRSKTRMFIVAEHCLN